MVLHFYDSLGTTSFTNLHTTFQRYILNRYQNENIEIIGHPVTVQKDGCSCGVYASAYAVTLALGNDPTFYNYSHNINEMRRHLAMIIETKQLHVFPGEIWNF